MSLAILHKDAYAHTPHDDVYGFEISPEYADDQTAYSIIRGNLYRTGDGGETWQRIVQGLDNTHGLSSLTISPQNKDVLYVSAIGDGVYKSLDSGFTWEVSNNELPSQDISFVIASKTSADIVLAIGNHSGLYRTADGGATWQAVDNTILNGLHLTTAAFVSNQSSVVYVGDAQGNLYVSQDLGATWTNCCSVSTGGAITAIAFSNNFDEDATLFIGTDKGKIFKSVNGGESLSVQDQGITSNHIQSLYVSADFTSDGTVYAVTRRNGVFRSENGGTEWNAVNEGLFTDAQAIEYKRPTFSLIRATETFAQDGTLFLASFTGIYKSNNRGDFWETKETLANEIIVGLAVSPPVDTGTVVGVSHYIGDAYLISDDGNFRVDVNQGWRSMELVERLLAPFVKRVQFGFDPDRLLSIRMRLHDVAFSPAFAEDQTAFVSLRNHLLRTTDGGATWTSVNINGDRFGLNAYGGESKTLIGFVIAPSPTFETDNTLFIGTQNGLILKSTDRGESVSSIGTFADKLTALQISPEFSTDNTLFGAGFHTGVHKSVDGGQTWTAMNRGLDIESGGLAGEFQLAVSPNYGADQTLFTGTVNGLFKSVDGGESWTNVPCDGCSTEWNISALAVSPDFVNDGTVVFAAKGVGILKSIDGGNSFVEVENSLINEGVSLGNLSNTPATSGAIKFSPNYAIDKTIYGFSGEMLVKSTDGGENWSVVSNSYLENAATTEIDLVFGQYFIYPILLFGGLVALLIVIVVGVWLIRRSRNRRRSMPFVQDEIPA